MLKSRAQLGFHGSGIEVATDSQNDIVGVNMSFVPVDQILASNGGDGGIFGLTRIGIVGTVG